MGTSYEDAGVSISAGEEAVALIDVKGGKPSCA